MIGRGALNTDFLYSVEVSDKLRSVAYQGPVVLMHADTSQQPNECFVIRHFACRFKEEYWVLY
jgi:hypothetical protein